MLGLYYHPLSSSCWKVLIALYESGTAFEPKLLNLGDPQEREAYLALWPVGKMPLLLDGERVVPETSVIVEYLAQREPAGAGRLVPQDAAQALEVRLMDRLLDLYGMMPMQAIVADRLRAEADRDALAVEQARGTLATLYGVLERKLEGREWMAGETFSLADCTAAPALFYAFTLVPLPPGHPQLAGYFERVLQRPSVARVLQEAGPFFRFYPFHDALPARFRSAG
jgi:glutathione S-transferase